MADETRRRISVEALRMRFRAKQSRRAAAAQAEASEVRLKEREVRHSFWRIVLQTLGGAVLLIGAYTAWLQLIDARSGQITDRFTRAVEQLGNQGAVDVRIGGIYALERIAQDSDRDRDAVAEVLSAFIVRASSAPNVSTTPSEAPTAADTASSGDATMSESLSADQSPAASEPVFVPRVGVRLDARLPPDLGAAIAVIARMYREGEPTAFNLRGAILRDADLNGALLIGADLTRADLRGADLRTADLRDADLTQADLRGQALIDTDLRGARLRGADLRGAILIAARLDGADLLHACVAPDAALPDAVALPGVDLSNLRRLEPSEQCRA